MSTPLLTISWIGSLFHLEVQLENQLERHLKNQVEMDSFLDEIGFRVFKFLIWGRRTISLQAMRYFNFQVEFQENAPNNSGIFKLKRIQLQAQLLLEVTVDFPRGTKSHSRFNWIINVFESDFGACFSRFRIEQSSSQTQKA